MRYLRQLCAAAILTFAVTFSAYAGEIECGITAAPPPPQAAGDMQNGVQSTDGDSTDAALLLIVIVLSLS